MAGFITAVQAEEAEHADTADQATSADQATQSDKVVAPNYEAGSDILGDGLDGMLVKNGGGEVQVELGQGASGGRTSINEEGRVQEMKDGTSSIVEAAKTLLQLNQVTVGKDALGTDLEGIEIQNNSGTPVVQLGELSAGVYGLKATNGEFKLVTSNLTIGKDALGSGLPGININDEILLGELTEGEYGIQITDKEGDTVFDNTGRFVGYTKNEAPDTEVFNGTITGGSWTQIDLSSVIGTRKALVFLSIENTGSTDIDFFLRPNGDTKYSTTGYTNVSRGTAILRVDSSSTSIAALPTDINGIVEYHNSYTGTSTITIEVITYIPITAT